MDLATVIVVLVLIALGGGMVAWPMGLLLREKDREIESLKALGAKFKDVVETERELDAARDLPPADELRVLFGTDPGQPPSS